MTEYNANLMHPAFLHDGDRFKVVGEDGPEMIYRSGKTRGDGSVRIKVALAETSVTTAINLPADTLVEVVK